MNIRQDLKEVPGIIRSVRPILLPYFGNIVATEKAGRIHDTITELDLQIENYLKEKFFEILPDVGFFGEEAGGEKTSRFWLVDPIDGTLPFARGIPFCTTMVALIEHGEVVFSAIYNFVTDTLFLAEKGKGAWENNTQIHVSDRSIKGALIKFETIREDDTHNAFKDRIYSKAIPFEIVVAGYEFCLVASGKIDGRICINPYGKDYDFAPGALLVSEAGGIVKNIGSDTYDYRNTDLIATNEKIYNEILDLL